MKKATSLYDFTLTAFGSQTILADANFYKILTSTGDVAITRDGGSTVKPMRAGRGERNVDFQRLILRDLSGATNAGTIVVGDSDFIDDTIILSSAINVRPEAKTNIYTATTTLLANTPDTVFTPGSNTAGAIIQLMQARNFAPNGGYESFVSKNGAAPTSPIDGAVLAFPITQWNNNASNNLNEINIQKDIFIEAGMGVYFVASMNMNATLGNQRLCRFKLL